MAYDSTLKILPDPTTVPEGPGFISQQVIQVDPGMVHPLNTGGTIAIRYQGAYWTININYPELTYIQGASILPFLTSLGGPFSNFYISLPTITIPQAGRWDSDNDFSGDLSVKSTNDKVLVIDGGSTVNGEFTIGDMIKLSNSHKIYQVLDKGTSGEDIELELSSSIIDPNTLISATIEPNDIKFRVRLAGQFTPPTLTANGLYDPFSLQLRENIR